MLKSALALPRLPLPRRPSTARRGHCSTCHRGRTVAVERKRHGKILHHPIADALVHRVTRGASAGVARVLAIEVHEPTHEHQPQRPVQAAGTVLDRPLLLRRITPAKEKALGRGRQSSPTWHEGKASRMITPITKRTASPSPLGRNVHDGEHAGAQPGVATTGLPPSAKNCTSILHKCFIPLY